MQTVVDNTPTAVDADWHSNIDEAGWVIVGGLDGPEAAERALSSLGSLVEQYGGVVRHEVRAEPGFDHLQYSKSRNGITPHTEAPGRNPPPRWLALYCHRQARCGGGQTLLADGYDMIDSLPVRLREIALNRLVPFDPVAGSEAPGPLGAPLFLAADGDRPPILRYSYNFLRDNDFDAPVHEDLDDLGDADPVNAEFCRIGLEHMRDRGFGVLPGDGDLLIFDNWRMVHARDGYRDPDRHLTRYWVS